MVSTLAPYFPLSTAEVATKSLVTGCVQCVVAWHPTLHTLCPLAAAQVESMLSTRRSEVAEMSGRIEDLEKKNTMTTKEKEVGVCPCGHLTLLCSCCLRCYVTCPRLLADGIANNCWSRTAKLSQTCVGVCMCLLL